MRFEFYTFMGGHMRVSVIAEDTPDTFILGHFSAHPGCPPIAEMSLPLRSDDQLRQLQNRGVQE